MAGFVNHAHSGVEKLRQNNEIHRNIVFGSRKNFLLGILIENQQLAAFERYFGSVYNMDSFTAAHVNHFDIVVCVLRKMCKTSVRAQSDKLSVLKQKRRVYSFGIRVCINGAVYFAPPIKQAFFLRCDFF